MSMTICNMYRLLLKESDSSIALLISRLTRAALKTLPSTAFELTIHLQISVGTVILRVLVHNITQTFICFFEINALF